MRKYLQMKRGLEQNSIQLQYIYIVIRQEQYKKMDQLVSNTTVNPGQNNKNTTAQIIWCCVKIIIKDETIALIMIENQKCYDIKKLWPNGQFKDWSVSNPYSWCHLLRSARTTYRPCWCDLYPQPSKANDDTTSIRQYAECNATICKLFIIEKNSRGTKNWRKWRQEAQDTEPKCHNTAHQHRWGQGAVSPKGDFILERSFRIWHFYHLLWHVCD